MEYLLRKEKGKKLENKSLINGKTSFYGILAKKGKG